MSASPEAEPELVAPTPSQPIVEQPAPGGRRGARPARPAPRCDRPPRRRDRRRPATTGRDRTDRDAGRLGPGREASRGATSARTAASAVEGTRRPTQRAKRDRARRRARRRARLTERRIGLMFAIFLVVLGLATLRAGYLLAFKGGDLKTMASTQHVQEVTLIAKRGTITDRHGAELAVSEDAATIFATPFLIKDPVATRAQLAPILERDPRTSCSRSSPTARAASRTSRARPRRSKGERIQKLEIEGIGVLDDSRRYYPEGELASQVIGSVGVDNKGLSGLEQQLDAELGGADGEQRIVRDARGEPVSLDQLADDQRRHRPAPDARRAAPGPRRAGAGRSGADLPAEGRDRDRDGPQHRRRPGDGELAARRRQQGRARRRRGRGSTARSGSPTSPAPPSSRSRSRARCRRTSCAPTRASRSARRSRSPTA